MPYHHSLNVSVMSSQHQRLSLIVYTDEAPTARDAMRCSAFDAGVQLRDPFEQPLGLPPIKTMLSVDFDGTHSSAVRLMQALALNLRAVNLVLLRLETLGAEAAGLAAQPQDADKGSMPRLRHRRRAYRPAREPAPVAEAASNVGVRSALEIRDVRNQPEELPSDV